MTKVKNKRNSGLADRVRNKRNVETRKKTLNPFEVHINREKLKVLGKKSKHDRGLPGVSRAKAIQKRKETLGVEMKLMNKTNAFIDRRIGEKDNQLSSEDRLIARFAAERVKQHSKKNIYNLADEEILTHRGQTLEQIEKFDDPRSSDEEDDGDGRKFGGLDDDFVSEGHFGGGVLSKTDSRDGAKSHKDLIEQLIAESKKRKAEKQKEKEHTLDLTEKLDSEWKDLQPVVFKKTRMSEKKEEPSIIDKLLSQAEKKAEDYDKTMRELRFEKRGTPSDGLKSEEQLEKEERKKLEKLEKEREQRMYDTDNVAPSTQTTNKHRSADDLDDNFDLEDEPNFMLAYDKDGKPLVPDNVMKEYSIGDSKKFEDGVSDSSDDDEEDEDDEEGDDENDDDKEQSDSNEEQSEQIEENANKNNFNVEHINKDVGDKDESIGLFSGANKDEELKGSDEGSDDDENSDDEEMDEEKVSDDLGDLRYSEEESEEEIENGEVDEKIHSFFDTNSSEGDNLKELFANKTPAQHATVLQKLIKCHDPSLAENNKERLNKLFESLVHYISDIFTNLKEEGELMNSFQIFNKLAPFLYDLAHAGVVITKKYLMEIITGKHEQFKKNPRMVPDLDTLILFKLVSLLYPTSDFKHPVTTPCLVFISEILTRCRFRDVYSITRGLFLVSMVLEYTVLSRRYMPAAVNFLRGILYLIASTSTLNPIQIVPPFRLHREVKFLALEEDCSEMAVGDKMAAKDLVTKMADNGLRIRCMCTTVNMLREFFDHFNDIESQSHIFDPHLRLLTRIDFDLYPKEVSVSAQESLLYMKQTLEVKTFTPLTKEKKRPKALKMYEPDIQEVFTGGKSGKLSREKVERDKLKHKYRREMKGALREIRRDKSYIASVKIKQKMQSDTIRKDKVKQIFKDASIQQSELNKLSRMKR